MGEIISTVAPIVTGLTGPHGEILMFSLVFVLVLATTGLILLGTYKIFTNASDFMARTITEQLKMLGGDLKKTGEALVSMQQSQIHFNGKLDNFDGRLEKVEEKVNQIKPI